MIEDTLDLGFGFVRNTHRTENPTIVYSPERNILISLINKNCSYSFEYWATENPQSGFMYVHWQEAQKIIRQDQLPTMITILRDPISRAKSAIAMLCEQHKAAGLSLDYNSFMNLEFVMDPHLAPQTLYVPFAYGEEAEYDPQYDIDTWYDLKEAFPGGWSQLLGEIDIVKYLTEHNVFFYMKPGVSVTGEIAKYLGEPELASHWNNSADHRSLSWEFSKTYIDYLRSVYDYDYKLINSVKFENV